MPDSEEKPKNLEGSGKAENTPGVSTVVHQVSLPDWMNQANEEHNRLFQRKEHDILELMKLSEIYHILRVANTQGTTDNNLSQRVLTPLMERMSKLVDPVYETDAVTAVEELINKEEKGK